MRELLLEIWTSVRRNKLRTFLTGFSVAWGIFMLVILLGSGNGLKNGTLSNFGSMAVNSVIINGGWTSQPYKGYDKWRRINITNRDLEILRTEFPEVDKVSARVQGPGQYNLSHGRDFLNNAAVVGSDPEYREIMNVRVLDGRFLNDTDLRERRKVIVVDKNVRDVLFHGQSPVGQHLLVNGTSYSIIGVFEMDQFGSYTFTFIPLTTAQLLFNHSDPSVGQTYLSVKDIDTDQKMAEFEQRLRNRLAAEHTFAPDDESAVWIYNRMEGYKNMMLVFGGINLFIWIIGLGDAARRHRGREQHHAGNGAGAHLRIRHSQGSRSQTLVDHPADPDRIGDDYRRIRLYRDGARRIRHGRSEQAHDTNSAR